jgi:DNA polymerase
MFEKEDLQPLREARAYLAWLQRSGALIPQSEIPQLTIKPRKPAASRKAAPQSAPSAPVVAASPEKVAELSALAQQVSECRKCPLGSQRRNAVFGVGNPDADLVFIGEAPGAREDATGEPFVGPAGKVLTQELARHGITREEVFICNIIKCRPPDNRDPLPDEIAACEPYLLRQLELLKPRMVCGLGRYAVGTLLKRPIGIMKIRGTWERYHDLPLFVCLHPSAVLHQPNNRPLFNTDIEKLAEAYHAREQ